jgi:carboxyl-terminal processing protease
MNKFVKYSLIGLVALVLLLGSFSGGFIAGNFTGKALSDIQPQSLLPANQQPDTSGPAETQTLFKPFWETWTLVHDQYVDQPVDDVALMQGAIRGMLAALGDQHTSYMDPQEFKDANADLNGSYEGIGAYVDTTADYLTIITPITGSPAEKAGLKPGDKIIAIDGEDMTGVTAELARRKVLGPAGTKVTLTILRAGVEKPFDVEITRDQIVIPTVESKMLDQGVAYVKINSFGDTTAADLHSALEELMKENPRGLILDLRNNPGGYLTTAITVASEFIGDGVIMTEEYGDGKQNIYKAETGGAALNIPMVVLVNEGSASASEIVAGAIQDRGRGKLIGVKTYGKGSVQIWTPLADDQGAVRITIAKWLTPNGRLIHKLGLEPDVAIEITAEDFTAGLDPQLDKAIEVLLGELPVQ